MRVVCQHTAADTSAQSFVYFIRVLPASISQLRLDSAEEVPASAYIYVSHLVHSFGGIGFQHWWQAVHDLVEDSIHHNSSYGLSLFACRTAGTLHHHIYFAYDDTHFA